MANSGDLFDLKMRASEGTVRSLKNMLNFFGNPDNKQNRHNVTCKVDWAQIAGDLIAVTNRCTSFYIDTDDSECVRKKFA